MILNGLTPAQARKLAHRINHATPEQIARAMETPTCVAVESSIDIARLDRESTWKDLARKRPISKWAASRYRLSQFPHSGHSAPANINQLR